MRKVTITPSFQRRMSLSSHCASLRLLLNSWLATAHEGRRPRRLRAQILSPV
jgi:hypothetical protein